MKALKRLFGVALWSLDGARQALGQLEDAVERPLGASTVASTHPAVSQDLQKEDQ